MQFERLRKSHKKEIIIGALAICVIGGILTFATSRAFYRVDDSIDLAKGTINYKAYDFKIMAMYKSDDKTNYTEIEEMPSEGYTINEDKSYCNMSNGDKDTTAILKTIDGNHIISKLKKNDKCFIYFDKYVPRITVDDIIAANNPKTDTPDFSQSATTDEGVYVVSDGMYGGTSYYWRGAVTNNYVKFAGFCWRIVRINGDKSVRLIYDGTTCYANTETSMDMLIKIGSVYSLLYSDSGSSEYVGWTYVEGKQRPEVGDTTIDSNAKTETEKWYNNNIENNILYSNKVTDGKFCNDREVVPGNSWSSKITPIVSPEPDASAGFDYAGYKRTYEDKQPVLSCSSGDVYTLKIGAITADEVVFAGDEGSYLAGTNYYTMSPSSALFPIYPSIIGVSSSGALSIVSNGSGGSYGLRPVINLKLDVSFSGGDGTLNNPYIVAD